MTPASGRRRAALEPMYASVGADIPTDGEWAFEPKYDGIRVLAFAQPGKTALVTRNGKQKARQFPEVVADLEALVRRIKRPVVLDGEIVALLDGSPGRFQSLQGRMHVTDAQAIERHAAATPAALIAFDLLLEGDDTLLRQPWTERRRRLERVLSRSSEHLRLGETSVGDGEVLLDQARHAGWEGIIAKRTDALYEPGQRTRNWRKLKIENRQELVIGGWTEPRGSREHLGALLLGYFEDGTLKFAGNTGGGFTNAGLRDMYRLLKPLEIDDSPFDPPPKTREVAHWVQPRIVVEVKFNEWTSDGKLRQPIFLGFRDDKDPREITREPMSVQRQAKGGKKSSRESRGSAAGKQSTARATKRKASRSRRGSRRGNRGTASDAPLIGQLETIEQDGGDGVLHFEDGRSLSVTSLGKVFFPRAGYTKGDLMRYYARVADVLLPSIDGRPLVLKRYPNGIDKPSFFQQNTGKKVPDGVRTAKVPVEKEGKQERFIGGDLLTLLYLVQLGCISVDPWHSRIDSLDDADYTILDLDPGPKATFEHVVDVARAVKEELDRASLHGALKTSGASGMHVYIPLPPGASYGVSIQLAELIAHRIASTHPKLATVKRSVSARPAAAVYVDYQQNIRGKSVAGVLAVRARPGATVSMPISWRALGRSISPNDFTIESAARAAQLKQAAKIWGVLDEAPASLKRTLAAMEE